MSQEKNRILAGHIPVIHRGYLDVIREHQDSNIRVFDRSITSRFDYLRKDIRMLEQAETIKALLGLGIAATSISFDELETALTDESANITLFDDDLSRKLVLDTEYVAAHLQYSSAFLRWDRQNANTPHPITPDRTINSQDDVVTLLYEEALKSTDWWRHVGAAIIEDDRVIKAAHNHGIPHEHINSIEGDPRSATNRGADVEKSLFVHAEADLIASMAREGVSTRNKSIYVTTFPCPNCAKLIAASGIKACYFVEGYAMLDGERTLRDFGVEIIQISPGQPSTINPQRMRPYPKRQLND